MAVNIPRWLPSVLAPAPVPWDKADVFLSEADDELQLNAMLLYLLRRAVDIILALPEPRGWQMDCRSTVLDQAEALRQWLLWRRGDLDPRWRQNLIEDDELSLIQGYYDLNDCVMAFDVYPPEPEASPFPALRARDQWPTGPVPHWERWESAQKPTVSYGQWAIEHIQRAAAFNIIFDIQRYVSSVEETTSWRNQAIELTILNATFLLAIAYGAGRMRYQDAVVWMIDSWSGDADMWLPELGYTNEEIDIAYGPGFMPVREQGGDAMRRTSQWHPWVPEKALDAAWTEVTNAPYQRRMWEIP